MNSDNQLRITLDLEVLYLPLNTNITLVLEKYMLLELLTINKNQEVTYHIPMDGLDADSLKAELTVKRVKNNLQCCFCLQAPSTLEVNNFFGIISRKKLVKLLPRFLRYIDRDTIFNESIIKKTADVDINDLSAKTILLDEICEFFCLDENKNWKNLKNEKDIRSHEEMVKQNPHEIEIIEYKT